MSVAPEPSPEPADHPTGPLVSAGASDRCASCGAHLAVDQRYCVECGTRRGSPRFNLTGQNPAAASASPADLAGSGRTSGGASRLRSSSSVVLLTGLLVILIALGVGVLIGHNNNVKPNKPANVTVNEIGGGASAGTAAASTGSAGTAATSGSSSTKSSAKKTASASKATKAPSKKVAAAAAATNPNAAATGKAGTAAAAKSFSNSATKKSTLGGSCTPGTTGCSTSGKQTGNLF